MFGMFNTCELRFVERIVHNERTATKKILQYRTRCMHLNNSNTMSVAPNWSDWEDVPIVQEAD